MYVLSDQVFEGDYMGEGGMQTSPFILTYMNHVYDSLPSSLVTCTGTPAFWCVMG